MKYILRYDELIRMPLLSSLSLSKVWYVLSQVDGEGTVPATVGFMRERALQA
jgi:hypothetical protein